MVERANAFTLGGKARTLVGPELQVGAQAPAFTAVANDLSPFAFEPGNGKVYILASVPSLDTGVCDAETRRFNQAAAELPGVEILTISFDLPFAQKRWCGAAGIDRVVTLSDHRDASFAAAYGTLIQDLRLAARATFVVDKAGKLAFVEYLPAAADQPSYEQVLAAARAAAE